MESIRVQRKIRPEWLTTRRHSRSMVHTFVGVCYWLSTFSRILSLFLPRSASSTDFSVYSKVIPRIVPFDLSDEAITSGQPVTIQCTVSEGDVPITFRWAFHGQELSSQMGITTIRINPRVSLLSIDSIAAGHAGNYTCTAQNSAGSVNYTATLQVQG